MTPEGTVKQQVFKSLYALEMSGYIYWFERLQSGQIHIGKNHIYQCRPGTHDFVAVFPDKKKNLSVAFIEVKRADKKALLSDNQKKFRTKHDGKHVNILFWLVQSGKEVERLVIANCYDRLKDIDL